MEENNNLVNENFQEQEERSFFNFRSLFETFILNWQWFALSLIICLGMAAIYLRYTTPQYQSSAKMLIKEDEETGRSSRAYQNLSLMGSVVNSEGVQNEMEILSSHTLATDVVRDLKLYVTYNMKGRVKKFLIYKTQPITVDIDPAHLETLNNPIALTITRAGNNYKVSGTYYVSNNDGGTSGPYKIEKTLTSLPQVIKTRAGILTFSNNGSRKFHEGTTMEVIISNPDAVSFKYQRYFNVGTTAKGNSIALMTVIDEIPQRAKDYLAQLVVCYNRQANEDKNEVALRTEKFINDRLEKINAELGETEGQLEEYKKQHHMTELRMNAQQAMSGAQLYDQRLSEANTQIAMINEVSNLLNSPSNKYQTIPSNMFSDANANALISKYNDLVMQRNRLLRTASEESPIIAPITEEIDEISNNIRNTMAQVRKKLEIQRDAVSDQYGKYTGQVSATPEQERMLTQIGRQQEVRSGLYLMLLQKREENSISLAATADKGKLIEYPQSAVKVTPVPSVILPVALLIGILLPGVLIFLVKFFRYKIEGHDDVARLTNLPIIADVAVASETAKTKADIVVHENKNNQMEEIFRAMRTNVQFMLKDDQKVVMFTSTTSGEGKTFNCANLAVSFALFDKRVIIVGLDIRKPRLAELFEINEKKLGITNLLRHEHPTEEDIRKQIIPSEVNKNLDLLLAGPVPPNPSELISRHSLEEVIDVLKKHYDYVIIDTAPVGLVTDTLQIGRVVDATVYLCRADYTPRSSFGLVNSLYAEGKLPNVAIVINGIDMSKKKYGYYYGYGKYGKYSRYSSYSVYGNYQSYGKYGKSYGGYGYGSYGYGSYGTYGKSHYANKDDDSIKL